MENNANIIILLVISLLIAQLKNMYYRIILIIGIFCIYTYFSYMSNKKETINFYTWFQQYLKVMSSKIIILLIPTIIGGSLTIEKFTNSISNAILNSIATDMLKKFE